MHNHQNHIKNLEEKLELLLNKQEKFTTELMGLYKEIDQLKKGEISHKKRPLTSITQSP